MKKKIGLFLMSVVLMFALAFGLTACGDKKDEGKKPEPEPPAGPSVTVDVQDVSLIWGETRKVTATVANSEKAAAFKLASGGDAFVALQVDAAKPNEATLKGLADGNTNLIVELEGVETPVTVPVKVEGKVRITAAASLTEANKVFDAKVTGEDDGETAQISVEHYLEGGKVEYAVEGSAAKIAVDGNNCTVTAHQAGVAKVTVTVSVPKAAEEQPEEQPEQQPEAQADEGEGGETEPVVEYEAVKTQVYTLTCTDDYNEQALAHISSKFLAYKEVKVEEEIVGYKAYISSEHYDDLADVEDKSLYVPAMHEGKPVVSLLGMGGAAFSPAEGKYFMSFEASVEGADAAECREIYAEFENVYLPCTLTEIPALAFRLSAAKKIQVQKDSQITTIGVQAFNEMYTLESLNTEDMTHLKTISGNAFNQAGHKADDSAKYKGVALTFPASLELIDTQAFLYAGVTEIKFLDDGDPETGVTIGVQAFMQTTKLTKVWLANIKQVKNQAFWLTGSLKELHIDANVQTTALGVNDFDAGDHYTGFAGLGFTGGAWNAVDIYLEGDNAVAKNVKEMGNNGYAAALGDNCGGLFGFATNAGFHRVIISTETKTEDIGYYLPNFFKRAATQDKEGYVIYEFLKYNWALNDPNDASKGMHGVDIDKSAKFVDPEEQQPEENPQA